MKQKSIREKIGEFMDNFFYRIVVYGFIIVCFIGIVSVFTRDCNTTQEQTQNDVPCPDGQHFCQHGTVCTPDNKLCVNSVFICDDKNHFCYNGLFCSPDNQKCIKQLSWCPDHNHYCYDGAVCSSDNSRCIYYNNGNSNNNNDDSYLYVLPFIANQYWK